MNAIRSNLPRAASVAVALVALAILSGPAASAHVDRPVTPVDGTGSVPAYRTTGPEELVCNSDRSAFDEALVGAEQDVIDRNVDLWTRCQAEGHRSIQDAVDAATAGTNILILPGVYREEESLQPPSEECADLDARWGSPSKTWKVLSWDQQVRCPHLHNLIAVLDKDDLQIEGTGDDPGDVVIDAQFQRLNAIRADRSDGFYVRNLTVQRTTFNGLYVMELDGFVIDDVVARWNTEYGFLTFATDHGLYAQCEAYGNGESGIYPGASSDINRNRGHDVERYATEITGCWSHDNLTGFSGTAGDSVWVHDSRFTDNTIGIGLDSVYAGHPGLPQNHTLFERNVIASNNSDYIGNVRSSVCTHPPVHRGIEQGVVCPKFPWQHGVGILVAGGNYNVFRDNWIYDNSHTGYMSMWIPAVVRGEMNPALLFDTSNENRFDGNHLGVDPDGTVLPNGVDVWWDGQGVANCFQQPTNGSEPLALPRCGADGAPAAPSTVRVAGEPVKLIRVYNCFYNTNLLTGILAPDCSWFGAQGLERFEVRLALVEAALIAAIMALMWLTLLRRRLSGLPPVLLAFAGAVVFVLGSAQEGTPTAGFGLLMLGAGWIWGGVLLAVNGRRALGAVTIALGAVAVVGFVDTTIWFLPILPIAPTWLRWLGAAVWVVWVVVAAVRNAVHASRSRSTHWAGTPS